MAFEYVTMKYTTEHQFEKLFVYFASLGANGYSRFYFATKRKESDSWTYWAGNASHELDTGLKLTSYSSVEVDAQTNYLRVQPDSNSRLLAVFPAHTLAKYVRIYIDIDAVDDSPTQLYEFRPSTRFAADELIAGKLHITDQFTTPPQIVVTKSSVDRVIIGSITDGYGIAGYDDSAATIFELSDQRQQIAGWTFTASEITKNGVSFNSNTGVNVATSAGITVANGGDMRINGGGDIYLQSATTLIPYDQDCGVINFVVGDDTESMQIFRFNGLVSNYSFGNVEAECLHILPTGLLVAAATTGIIIGEDSGGRVRKNNSNQPQVDYITISGRKEIDFFLGDNSFPANGAGVFSFLSDFASDQTLALLRHKSSSGGMSNFAIEGNSLFGGGYNATTTNIASYNFASLYPDSVTIKGGLALYTTPATPVTATANCGKLYVATTDGLLHYLDESGNDYDLTASGGETLKARHGGRIANNTTDSDHDIDIYPGYRISEVDWATGIELTATLTKRIDAAWAEGSGAGGLDTGSVAANTSYHVWWIKSNTATVDAVLSLSATNPTTTWPHRSRLGAVLTDGSSNIVQFEQIGLREFLIATPILDYSNKSITTTATLLTLSVPNGINTKADFNIRNANTGHIVFTSPYQKDSAPSTTAAPLIHFSPSSNDYYGKITMETNKSRKIRARSTSNVGVYIAVTGWTDIELN